LSASINDVGAVEVSAELRLDATTAFEVFVDELALALERLGMQLESGPGGRVLEGDDEVGAILSWVPGERIELAWRPVRWEPVEQTTVGVRFDAVGEGTSVTVEHRGFERLLGGPEGELAGWFAANVAAPFLLATSPARFGDWLTDRLARRPSGAQARATYRDPVYHRPNFRVILEELALSAEDHLLEVGCGGGVFLKEALRSGCRAAAIDHSLDMVRLAREVNREALEAGRLEIVEASADRLPFADHTFTCAVMTGVLGFLPDPVQAFAEIGRVLAPGGRLVVLGSDPAERGTLAAPEPMASRLRFYDDDELARLAREAGLVDAHVVRRRLQPFAREAGVPDEHLGLFGGKTPFLIAFRGARA
jgi:SAM-dependent methyltransferase